MADQRIRNRLREHGAHGWQVVPTPGKPPSRATQELVRCPCGWFGWVDQDVAPATTSQGRR